MGRYQQDAKMLGAAIHLMRGTPYIYQGEELGMTNAHFTAIEQYRDVESLNYYRILRDRGETEAQALETLAQRSRDNGRTPMQWDAGPNAGFTAGTPWIGAAGRRPASCWTTTPTPPPAPPCAPTRRWCWSAEPAPLLPHSIHTQSSLGRRSERARAALYV